MICYNVPPVESPQWYVSLNFRGRNPMNSRGTGYDSAARPGRLLQRWASLAALLLCVGHSVADTHVHLDEHEEEVCTLCAIVEPGHATEAGCVAARPSQGFPCNSMPVVSATLSPRPYEVGRPRAPPISVF